MTDYNIEVEIEWGSDGEPLAFAVTTQAGQYFYTAEELEGTNLLSIIENEKITVYGQEQQYTREEHRDLYGW